MENEEKEKPSSSTWREEIERCFPNLKIVDATEEMIGKTSLFTWYRPRQKDQNGKMNSSERQKDQNQ
jgi:hypothetical protein